MRQSGALQFFCTQALGIMLEDGVIAIYKRSMRPKKAERIAGVEKAIGCLWVMSFIVWSSPVWVFPVTINTRKEHALLGPSAIQPFFWPRGYYGG